VDAVDCEDEIGEVEFGVAFLEVDFLVEQLPQTAAAAVVEEEEVEVALAEGVIQLNVEAARDGLVDLLLSLERTQSLFVQVLDLDHLHREQVLRVPLPHQEHLAVRTPPDLLQYLEVCEGETATTHGLSVSVDGLGRGHFLFL
jgi:hypothetical protein